MKTYQKHLSSVGEIKVDEDVYKKQVHRASAIFTVFNSKKINSRILFMNYWLVKRKIKELGLTVTLRNHDGKIVIRENSILLTAKAFEINLIDLLKKLKIEKNKFVGSLEIELFSLINLVFPYPALVVNYYNEYGSSFVHTAGRIYNDFDDLIENDALKVKESGFDIYTGDRFNPFFSFTNGYKNQKSNIIEVELLNKKGTLVREEIDLGKLNPYQTVIFYFKDYFALKKILGNSTGTVRIKHDLKGFFPRFICGNECKISGAISVTHSYYDSSSHFQPNSYLKNNNPKKFMDYSVFIPLFIQNNYYTEMKIYPINSPSNYTLNLTFYSGNGELIGGKEKVLSIDKNHNTYNQLNFHEIVEKLGIDSKVVKSVLIEQNFKDKNKIPSRLKYGLNIGKQKSKYNLPTNICFNSEPVNEYEILKKGTFKWFPIINSSKSLAIITNSSFIKDYNKKAKIKMTIYKVDSEDIIDKIIELNPYEQYELIIDNKISTFLDNKSGWVTLTSNNPFVRSWYFDFNKSGIMGGDHTF